MGLQRVWVRRQGDSLQQKHQAKDSAEGLLEKQVVFLNSNPVRDLSLDPVSVEFLKDKKVYVSLTTSPDRIENLKYVLETLDLTHVEAVIVALPLRFSRNQGEYKIPEFLSKNPKVKIIRSEKDYGPATKLVPAVQYLQKEKINSVVITVDDDTGYARGMLNELIYAGAHIPNSVIGRSGVDLDAWKLREHPLPKAKIPVLSALEGVDSAVPVDVIEGFAGVLYPTQLVNADRIIEWSSKCREFFLADDMVISLSLAKDNVPKTRFVSRFNPTLIQFHYGMGTDALHKGGGRALVDEQNQNYNLLNYRQVMKVLDPEFEITD